MKRALLTKLQAARRAKQPAALVTDTASGAQTLIIDGSASGDLALTPEQLAAAVTAVEQDRSGPLTTGSETEADRLFVQVFNPPLRMIVVGAVHIAQSLVPMGVLTGYEVILVDPRRGWANEARFPGQPIVDAWPDEALEALSLDRRTAVVLLSHDPKLDDPALVVALRSPVFYIGALGSRKTQAKRRERMIREGFSESEIDRIHGPVGLPLGARSPAEIAVSILAEVTQVRHRQAASSGPS